MTPKSCVRFSQPAEARVLGRTGQPERDLRGADQTGGDQRPLVGVLGGRLRGRLERAAAAAGRTLVVAACDLDLVGARDQVGEQVVAVGVGDRATDDVAGRVAQGHADARDARLAGVAGAVVVRVEEHQVAQDQRAVEAEVLGAGAIFVGGAGVEGGGAGRAVGVVERGGAGGQGQHRAAYHGAEGRAVVEVVARVAGHRLERGAGSAGAGDVARRGDDFDLVSAGDEVGEQVAAVGRGGGGDGNPVGDDRVAGPVEQADGDAADRAFPGVAEAVVVEVVVNQVAEGELAEQAEVLPQVGAARGAVGRRVGRDAAGAAENDAAGLDEVGARDGGAVVGAVEGIGPRQARLERPGRRADAPRGRHEAAGGDDADDVVAGGQPVEQVVAA